MSSNWQVDLNDSNKDFMRLVWPEIKQYCGNGSITPVETIQDNKIAKQLDMLAGIDIWQVVEGKGVRGIASRVQWTDKSWNTFTIRLERFSGAETEYKKRLGAIKSNEWIYPYYTCQAYVTKRGGSGNLLSCGIAKTTDIFTALESGSGGTRETYNASFRWINWKDVIDCFVCTPTPAPRRNDEARLLTELEFWDA